MGGGGYVRCCVIGDRSAGEVAREARYENSEWFLGG